MYAKLIIYQQDPMQSDWRPNADGGIESGDLTSTHFVAMNQVCWQLTANNLTTGKVSDLLVCLDELGFSDEILNSIDSVRE